MSANKTPCLQRWFGCSIPVLIPKISKSWYHPSNRRSCNSRSESFTFNSRPPGRIYWGDLMYLVQIIKALGKLINLIAKRFNCIRFRTGTIRCTKSLRAARSPLLTHRSSFSGCVSNWIRFLTPHAVQKYNRHRARLYCRSYCRSLAKS